MKQNYYIGILIHIDAGNIFKACMSPDIETVKQEGIQQKLENGWFTYRFEIHQLKKGVKNPNNVFYTKEKKEYCVNFYLDNGYILPNIPCPFIEYCKHYNPTQSKCVASYQLYPCEYAYEYDVVEKKTAPNKFIQKYESQLLLYFKEKYLKK